MLHFKRGVLPVYKTVLRQELNTWREELLTTVAVPLTFFLAFGLGLRGYIHDIDGVSYMTFLAPGLITLTMLFEAYRNGGWGMWLDRWLQKMIDEYRIKPVTTSDIIVGKILGGFTEAIIKGAVVALVLKLIAPISFAPINILPYLLYMLPGSVLFTCMGAMVGTVCAKPDQIAQVQTVVITPLLYLGGMFFPIRVLPPWLLPIIHWLPTTALFEGGRWALLKGQIQGFDIALLWGAAILCFGFTVRLFNDKLSE